MLAVPGLVQRYYAAVADRTLVRMHLRWPACVPRSRQGPQDKSTAVRKRVVRLLRDILVGRPGEVDAADVCARLLARSEDDETSVQDEAVRAVQETLLSVGSSVPPWPAGVTDPPVPRPLTDLPLETRALLATRLEVLASLAGPGETADRLVRLVQRVRVLSPTPLRRIRLCRRGVLIIVTRPWRSLFARRCRLRCLWPSGGQ
jgi:hypothetical protein